ncbi:MAG: class F420-dependent oxidoreductase [Solirubrobacterales bacterium]|nr:class F420-dependent oxidoreductase [Solirubrobacterales bacterium]
MKFGIGIFSSDDGVFPGDLGRMVEDRGFESLWFSEHTHIPVRRETPYPGGGDLPPFYRGIHDPLISLAAAGASTDRLRLGTGVCLVAQRDPIVTAKATATLDLITHGRLLFGVGAGWNREEMRNHGTDPQTRGALLDERLQAIKAMWTQEESEFHGRFVDFDPIWSWPKPEQKPHPPILVGGNSDRCLDRVVAHGDEWMPHRTPVGQLRERIAELHRRADIAGRPPLPVTVYGGPTDAAQVEELACAGVHRVVWVRLNGRADVIEPSLDEYARLAASFGASLGA